MFRRPVGMVAVTVVALMTDVHLPLFHPTPPTHRFLSAIETSGGFGDPFLFGLLPVLMAWRQRYGDEKANEVEGEGEEGASTPAATTTPPLLPGGKVGLTAMGAVTVAMLLNKGADYAPDLVAMMGGAMAPAA